MSDRRSPDSIILTYDLLKWAIPTIIKFPRDQRFLLVDRIENHILDVLIHYLKQKAKHLNFLYDTERKWKKSETKGLRQLKKEQLAWLVDILKDFFKNLTFLFTP